MKDRLDNHAAGAVEGGTQRARERRRGDAGGPEHRAGRHALGPDSHAVAVDAGDARARCGRGRRAARAAACALLRELRGSGGRTRRAALDEDDPRAARDRWCGSRAQRRGGRSRRARRRARRRSGPPPTMTKVSSACWRSDRRSRSARSKARRTRRRISSASSSVLRPGAKRRPLVVAEVGVASRRWRR